MDITDESTTYELCNKCAGTLQPLIDFNGNYYCGSELKPTENCKLMENSTDCMTCERE